jgi:hypothetical protein
MPPPPHVLTPLHGPQSSAPPQPSSAGPQLKPRSAQVFRVHAQTPGAPLPPQVAGDMQLPQSSVPPQLSGAGPQLTPRLAQVVGVQIPVPQWLAACAPQVWPVGHEPHWMTPPQSSETVPHSAPAAAQVSGWPAPTQAPHVPADSSPLAEHAWWPMTHAPTPACGAGPG